MPIHTLPLATYPISTRTFGPHGAAKGFMLQRMQESLGLKANTQQWQLTSTLTFTT